MDVTSSKCPINVRVNMIQQRKGKAEDKDPEVLLPEKLLLKSSVPKRRERIRLAKKIDLQDEELPIGKGLSLRKLPTGRSFHIFLNEKVKEKGLQQKGLQLLCEQCKSAAWKPDAQSETI